MWDVGQGNGKGRGKAENPLGSAPVLWGIWHVKKLAPRENLSIVTFLCHHALCINGSFCICTQGRAQAELAW